MADRPDPHRACPAAAAGSDLNPAGCNLNPAGCEYVFIPNSWRQEEEEEEERQEAGVSSMADGTMEGLRGGGGGGGMCSRLETPCPDDASAPLALLPGFCSPPPPPACHIAVGARCAPYQSVAAPQ
jgi:hypothetical protein